MPLHSSLLDAGLQHDGDAFSLVSERDLRTTSTIYNGTRFGSTGGKGVLRQADTPPHPLLAVHRVRWNPNGGLSKAWLAHGGASGFLRLQHIPTAESN